MEAHPVVRIFHSWLCAVSSATIACCQASPSPAVDRAELTGSAMTSAVTAVLSSASETRICIPDPMLVAMELVPRTFGGSVSEVEEEQLASWASPLLPQADQQLMILFLERLRSTEPPPGPRVLVTVPRNRPLHSAQIEDLVSALLKGKYVEPEFSVDQQRAFWILVTAEHQSSSIHLVSLRQTAGRWQVEGHFPMLSIE